MCRNDYSVLTTVSSSDKFEFFHFLNRWQDHFLRRSYITRKKFGERCATPLCPNVRQFFFYCLEEKYLFRTDFLFAQEMDYQGAQPQESWVRTTRWWRSKIILWSSATWGAGWSTSRWLVGPTPAHSGTRTYKGKSQEQFLSHTTLVYFRQKQSLQSDLQDLNIFISWK